MDQNAMRLTEDQVILDTVMSISSLLTALETNEELAADQRHLLRMLELNNARLYRPLYVQRILRRREDGRWQHGSVRLGNAVDAAAREARRILREAAEVRCEVPQGVLWMESDANVLADMLYAAVALTCPDSSADHELLLRLEKREEDRAELTVMSRSKPSEAEGCTPFGTLAAERRLVAAFCEEYGCTQVFTESAQAHTLRISLPLSDGKSGMIQLQSGAEEHSRLDGSELLLARLRWHAQEPAESVSQ
jgi:hypothetical protein